MMTSVLACYQMWRYWSHTFVEIDHELISTVILLPSAESFKKGSIVVSYKRKYVHEVLVYCIQACPGKSVVMCHDHSC